MEKKYQKRNVTSKGRAKTYLQTRMDSSFQEVRVEMKVPRVRGLTQFLFPEHIPAHHVEMKVPRVREFGIYYDLIY